MPKYASGYGGRWDFPAGELILNPGRESTVLSFVEGLIRGSGVGLQVDIRVPVGLPVRETAEFIAGCRPACERGPGSRLPGHTAPGGPVTASGP